MPFDRDERELLVPASRVSRPHLALLLTGFGEDAAGSALELLGATTTIVSPLNLTAQLRYGASSRLTADAIVVDATTVGEYDPDLFIRISSLIGDVRRLADAKMITGVRWSGVPIVVVVKNDAAKSVADYWGLGGESIVCSSFYGWLDVYNCIAHAVLEFSLDLVRQMRELGWDIIYHSGRWIRVRGPSIRRKGGFVQDLESELYDARSDAWLSATTPTARRKLSIVASHGPRTLEDILKLQRLIVTNGVTELALQRLVEEAPYLLRASQTELIAQPLFLDEATQAKHYPDIVVHPHTSDAINIVELKLPTASLVAKRGKLVYQSSDVTAGVAQTREYAEIVIKPRHRSQMEALFGLPVSVSSKTLVLGMTAGADPEQLEQIGSYIPDVEILGWDEILTDAVRRYVR